MKHVIFVLKNYITNYITKIIYFHTKMYEDLQIGTLTNIL